MKTTKKTPKVGELVPQPNGRGALRYGGTNRGGPGRPPDKDKAFLEALLASQDCQNGLQTIFKTGARAPELFLKTWDKVWDKVKSKPPVQIEGGDERTPLTIRLVRE